MKDPAVEIREHVIEWAEEAFQHLDAIWCDAPDSGRSMELLNEYRRIKEEAAKMVLRPVEVERAGV